MRDLPAELGRGVEEGTYLAVGMALLGWQRAQVRRRQLADAPLPIVLAGMAGSFVEPALLPLKELARGLAAEAKGRPAR